MRNYVNFFPLSGDDIRHQRRNVDKQTVKKYNDDELWHFDLLKEQLMVLLRKIRHDIETSTNSITETANWMTTNIDGTRLLRFTAPKTLTIYTEI